MNLEEILIAIIVIYFSYKIAELFDNVKIIKDKLK